MKKEQQTKAVKSDEKTLVKLNEEQMKAVTGGSAVRVPELKLEK